MKPNFLDLGFYPQPEQIIAAVAQRPWSFYLDSSSFEPSLSPSAYSYVGFDPDKIISGDLNPWKKFAENFSPPQASNEKLDHTRLINGWVGYLGFETAAYLHPFTSIGLNPASHSLPSHWLGHYPAVLVLNQEQQTAQLGSWSLNEVELENLRNRWREYLEKADLISNSNPNNFEWLEYPEYKPYSQKIKKIRQYLEAGDFYQVNFTCRFKGKTSLSPQTIYSRLRQTSPVPYGAFFNLGDFKIHCASPERFFKIEKNIVTTSPIKGTIKRIPDNFTQDQENQNTLMNSSKDQAELLMITDLERNDLGKVCEFGSVHVTHLKQLQQFAQVHHLVSHIQGKLKSSIHPVEALEALFPGGSITGAPKKRALEIIHELEDQPRGLYTGALGYFDTSGNGEWNIPIRTMMQTDQEVFWYAGGGITIDSQPRLEYEEMLAKSEGMLQTLSAKRK